jgi:hypothetical protein
MAYNATQPQIPEGANFISLVLRLQKKFLTSFYKHFAKRRAFAVQRIIFYWIGNVVFFHISCCRAYEFPGDLLRLSRCSIVGHGG